MAIQLSVAVRNARLDEVEVEIGTAPILEIRSGAKPANCAAADAGTLLASMTLPSDWMALAAAGVKGLSGTWEDAAANAAGVAGHFRVKESTGTTTHIQGDVGGSGSGSDMELQNTNIALGQPITITQFNLTDGNP